MAEKFDVLIVGGGMVGASLARAISGQGLSIGLVEAFEYHSDEQPSYDDRVLALSWGSRRILQAMGLWEPSRFSMCISPTAAISALPGSTTRRRAWMPWDT